MKVTQLGELEKQVMEIVWQTNAPISVRGVTESIQKKRLIAYTTVMTVMGRLVTKGLLARKFDTSHYIYSPTLTKETYMAKAAHTIFTAAVSMLGTQVVTHFAKEISKISPTKRRELLRVLSEK